MQFDSVVFAGGGCRCFWQAGFWEEAGSHLQPRVISAVSAGAAFACAALGGRSSAVLQEFKRRTAANPSNLHLRNLGRGRSPFPHHGMYRGTIEATIDASMLERLRPGPEIRVLLAHPPTGWRLGPAVAMGLLSYRADRLLRRRVHPQWPRRLGFRPRVVRANDCETPGELADLILQSSCLPPLMPILRREGEAVVDGAVIDSAPVHLVEGVGTTLVLLTQHDEAPPPRKGVVYVPPSAKIPIELWDYTSPERVQATYDLGRTDGRAFVHALRAGRIGAPS